MSAEWTEENLEDLRQFFYCEGRQAAMARFVGASLCTYPNSDDPNQQSLYTGCQELERRGLIRSRLLPDGAIVAFYGPCHHEWDHPSDTAITAALGIPAELLRNDGSSNAANERH